MNRPVWLAAIVTGSALLGGCLVGRTGGYVHTTSYPAPAETYAEVYVNTAPPAPVVEYRSYPPGPGYVWIDGYWDWSGYEWQWVGGRWVQQQQGYYLSLIHI